MGCVKSRCVRFRAKTKTEFDPFVDFADVPLPSPILTPTRKASLRFDIAVPSGTNSPSTRDFRGSPNSLNLNSSPSRIAATTLNVQKPLSNRASRFSMEAARERRGSLDLRNSRRNSCEPPNR